MSVEMTLNLNRGDGVSVRARRRDGVDVAARVHGRGDGVVLVTVSTQVRARTGRTLFVGLLSISHLKSCGARAIPQQ